MALEAIEAALDAPAPGRMADWIKTVIAALDALIAALAEQADHNRHPDSLLTQIADEQPRFSSQIAQLEDDLDELIAAEKALRSELTLSSELQPDQVRTRQLLADLDARYRVLRAREADLVFEAFHLDIGGKG
ncbi:MAG TPA: hypothetical protein VEB69_07945 [Acidimicrobiia bacterium]|nr:hypothetical protein [Acidimicrobiia bacterium]